jgi:hypothetical protein
MMAGVELLLTVAAVAVAVAELLAGIVVLALLAVAGMLLLAFGGTR